MKNIEAKIDTGAYTCALHCHTIAEKELGGKKVLCFFLLDPSHEEYHQTEHVFFDYSRKKIKSSSGEFEERYIIKTIVRLGRRRIRTTISLTDRGNMRYPVLIGRKLLRGKFIVDVSRMHTNGILFKKAFL
ncbi:MAG: ATP-dependent zinc protease [Bacteroidia bacterium]|nr:ATP-dependent zinc protease [Bacteroidia bacterium]